jgi:hypothetical protein
LKDVKVLLLQRVIMPRRGRCVRAVDDLDLQKPTTSIAASLAKDQPLTRRIDEAITCLRHVLLRAPYDGRRYDQRSAGKARPIVVHHSALRKGLEGKRERPAAAPGTAMKRGFIPSDRFVTAERFITLIRVEENRLLSAGDAPDDGSIINTAPIVIAETIDVVMGTEVWC